MAVSMQWVRLQTTMFENPKMLNLKEDKCYRAIITYLEGLTYSGRNGLAGYIPKLALKAIGAVRSDVERLVREGLWCPAPGGYQINGWNEYQLADSESLARSEKAKKAAAARWAGRNGNHVDQHA